MTRRILVTGGAGFIGSHLVDALLQRGDEVTVLDCFEPFYAEEVKRRNLNGALDRGARLVESDIRRSEAVERVVAETRPELVVHLAARPGVVPSLAEPGLYVDINVRGTINVLEACRRAGVTDVVFASSSSVYGLNERVPFREDDPILAPASPYGATKAAGELLCHTYSHLHGLRITCLRFFTAYGPRQRPDMAIHKFARLLSEGQAIPVYGRGTARDYTFVSDIVGGVMLAMERPRPFAVYNLGDSRRIELEEMISVLAAALGVEPKLDRRPPLAADVKVTLADISRARDELGYDPTVPFETGVRIFADWFAGARTSG